MSHDKDCRCNEPINIRIVKRRPPPIPGTPNGDAQIKIESWLVVLFIIFGVIAQIAWP